MHLILLPREVEKLKPKQDLNPFKTKLCPTTETKQQKTEGEEEEKKN